MASKFPSDWKLIPLEDCMVAIIDYRGITPKKSSFGVPLITAKIVKGGRLLDVNEYIPSEDYDEWMRRGLPEPGDVVMTTEAPLGEIAQLDNRKVALAQRLITLRGKPDLLDNTFLKFLMMSDFVQRQLHARSTGTTVFGIKQSELRKVSLLIPPLHQQRAIARIMGTLDEKIAINQRTRKTLETIAHSIFKAWFIENPKVNEFRSGLLGEIAYFIKGVSYRSVDLAEGANTALVTLKSMERGGGYRDDGLKPFIGDYKTEQQVLPGEVVVAQTDLTQAADVIGRAARVEPSEEYDTLVASLDMMIVRPKEGFTSEYLYGLLSRDEYVDHSYGYTNGTTVLHLGSRALPEFRFLIPPVELVKSYSELVSPIFDQIDKLNAQVRALKVLSSTLLPKLINGDVYLDSPEKFLEA